MNQPSDFQDLKKHLKKIVKRIIAKDFITTPNKHGVDDQLNYSVGSRVVLVYTMPKVGSNSIFYALKKESSLKIPIYKTHFLNPNSLTLIRKNSHQLNAGSKKYIQTSQFLRTQLEQKLVRRNWKVITLIREPISREISSFFQRIEQFYPDFYRRYDSGALTLQEMISDFLDYSLNKEPDYWFERELQHVFNIDVFAQDFPRSEGFKIYEHQVFFPCPTTKFPSAKSSTVKSFLSSWSNLWTHNSVDLLLIKLEHLDACAAKAVGEFLNIDNFFTLSDKNLAKGKAYYKVYKEFVSSVDLPQSYIDRMYNSRYSQHFYSEEELNKFRVKWSKSKV